MPIHVEVFLNENELGELVISRLEDLKSRDSNRYEYQVEIFGPHSDTSLGRTKFFHTRSQSVWILMQEALVALRDQQLLPSLWEKTG